MQPDSLSKQSTSHITRDVNWANRVISTGPGEFSGSDIARFWAKVDRRGPDECWLWTASTLAGRYGQFTIGSRLTRIQHVYAHRISYAMANGGIPEGGHVLHCCDVPLCVNPGHLFLGTHTDNMQDASAKGRLAVTRTRNRLAKPEAIRRYLAGEATQRELAAEYHVNKLTVNRWLKGLHAPYARPSAAPRLKRTA